MSVKLRSHGGRYLNLDKNQKLSVDTGLDLDRSSEDLEKNGSVFKVEELETLKGGDNNRSPLLNEQGEKTILEDQDKQYKVFIEKFGDEHQWTLKASGDGAEKYVVVGLQGLRLEDDIEPLGIFSMITQ
ncbi:unnamed protein product [Umbelopsis ramanniana]